MQQHLWESKGSRILRGRSSSAMKLQQNPLQWIQGKSLELTFSFRPGVNQGKMAALWNQASDKDHPWAWVRLFLFRGKFLVWDSAVNHQQTILATKGVCVGLGYGSMSYITHDRDFKQLWNIWVKITIDYLNFFLFTTFH